MRLPHYEAKVYPSGYWTVGEVGINANPRPLADGNEGNQKGAERAAREWIEHDKVRQRAAEGVERRNRPKVFRVGPG